MADRESPSAAAAFPAQRPRQIPVPATAEPLRPAIGVAIFLVAVAIAFVAGGAAPIQFALRGATATHAPLLTSADVLRNGLLAFSMALTAVLLASAEHRRFLDYGMRAHHPIRNLLGGNLSGLALVSALVLLLHQLDLLVFRGQVLYGISLQWKLAFRWLAFSALAAFAAEFLFHGYLQYTLTRAFAGVLRRHLDPAANGDAAITTDRIVPVAFWTAALLLSVAAAAALSQAAAPHTAVGLLNVSLFSLLMAFSLWRTGSLWWAWGFHLAWDWAQSFLWGVPVVGMRTPGHLFRTEITGPTLQSGGTAGPSSSLYAVGAMCAAFGILMLLHKARVYPELWASASADQFHSPAEQVAAPVTDPAATGSTDSLLPDADTSAAA